MLKVVLLFSLQADRVVIGGDHFFRSRKRLKLVLILFSFSWFIFYFSFYFPDWIALFEGRGGEGHGQHNDSKSQ